METNEIVFYIVIPIIASLLGGAFTFLSLFFTIRHERRIREEDLKIREAEQQKIELEKQKIESQKNIERNKRIIQTRPELTITDNSENIIAVEIFYLLPFVKPKLIDEKRIEFGYSDEIFRDDYWNKYEVILQNTGKREIISSFLQAPYQSYFNIYSKVELDAWQSMYSRNYYNDSRRIGSNIKPNEKIKLIIYYPKNSKNLNSSTLNLYMRDEDGNHWFQQNINSTHKIRSEVISSEAYNMNCHNECNFWYTYASLYVSKNTEKYLKKDISNSIDERIRNCHKKEEKIDNFKRDVNTGKIQLDYNLPLA